MKIVAVFILYIVVLASSISSDEPEKKRYISLFLNQAAFEYKPFLSHSFGVNIYRADAAVQDKTFMAYNPVYSAVYPFVNVQPKEISVNNCKNDIESVGCKVAQGIAQKDLDDQKRRWDRKKSHIDFFSNSFSAGVSIDPDTGKTDYDFALNQQRLNREYILIGPNPTNCWYRPAIGRPSPPSPYCY